MAGLLGPRDREAQIGEEAPLTPFDDLTLGLLVRRRRRGSDRVDAELLCDARELLARHGGIVPTARFAQVAAPSRRA